MADSTRTHIDLVRIRVIDLETGGNGPHDVCEVGWQDVVQGPDGQWCLNDERGSRLVNPGRPISPETMAVHHIMDEDVAEAPVWRDIAQEVLRPQATLRAFAAHRAAFEQRYCTPRLGASAPWICTWKCSLRVWPELQSHSNQMLRYQRMPVGLDRNVGLPAHRAMPDAYVTAHHLRDMLNTVPIEALLAWSSEPGLLPRVRSGPDRGRPWDHLGEEALRAYAKDRDADVRFTAQVEIRRREGVLEPSPKEPAQGRLL